MLTGGTPFAPHKKTKTQREFFSKLYDNILKKPPRMIEAFDPKLKELIEWMLEKKGSKRPTVK